jgi:hypothetical protein
MSATDSTSKYSAKRRILYGFTTGGLVLGGIGMAAAAQADAAATGTTADSPGVASGNLINIPIDLPINLCGNTLNVIGIGDSAHGNSCANESGNGTEGTGGATATGSATNSPGVGSGNLINIPVNVPVNACGNTVSVVGIGNTTHGDSCANGGPSTGSPTNCGCTPTPPPPPPVVCPPGTMPTGTDTPAPPAGTVAPTGTLASTGSGAMAVAPLGLGLLGGGGYLSRRGLLKSAAK